MEGRDVVMVDMNINLEYLVSIVAELQTEDHHIR
jgi:hypothetical protein